MAKRLSNVINKLNNQHKQFQFTHERRGGAQLSIALNNSEEEWDAQRAVNTACDELAIRPYIKKMFEFEDSFLTASGFKISEEDLKNLENAFIHFGYEVQHAEVEIVPGRPYDTYIWLRMFITNETLESQLIELSSYYKALKNKK